MYCFMPADAPSGVGALRATTLAVLSRGLRGVFSGICRSLGGVSSVETLAPFHTRNRRGTSEDAGQARFEPVQPDVAWVRESLASVFTISLSGAISQDRKS